MRAPAKYSLVDDYSNGVHPKLLEGLVYDNQYQPSAYEELDSSADARGPIRHRLQCSDQVGVWFVPSGTSANTISIASCLRPHESVLAASSGHIVVRETGAVKATGHKIISIPPEAEKLTPASISRALEQNWHFPHMSRPRLVYFSNATELGTVYTRAELEALKGLCVRNDFVTLPRRCSVVDSHDFSKKDLTWPDFLELTDLFWIVGTKNGALLGEAIIIKGPRLARDFDFHVKQHGCLLAKS
ncbi:hypothetical protein DV737_g5118, partial [Chaetothyriales sp. CBS 132003]